MAGSYAHRPRYDSSAYRRSERRWRAGRPGPWHEVAPAERDAHDWLYAVARQLLEDGQEVAARLVMDFADETDEVLNPTRPADDGQPGPAAGAAELEAANGQ